MCGFKLVQNRKNEIALRRTFFSDILLQKSKIEKMCCFKLVQRTIEPSNVDCESVR